MAINKTTTTTGGIFNSFSATGFGSTTTGTNNSILGQTFIKPITFINKNSYPLEICDNKGGIYSIPTHGQVTIDVEQPLYVTSLSIEYMCDLFNLNLTEEEMSTLQRLFTSEVKEDRTIGEEIFKHIMKTRFNNTVDAE